MDASLIEQMARLRGIGEAYHDYRGELRHFSLETKAGILRAMGCAVDDPRMLAAELEGLERARAHALVPPSSRPAAAAPKSRSPFLAMRFEREPGWRLTLESGERRAGSAPVGECPEMWRGPLGGAGSPGAASRFRKSFPRGYHELEVQAGEGASARSLAVVSPPACYEPAAVLAGRRLWGLAVQLYTVRSAVNWGIGDFDDLGALIRWVARRGAGFIGLNPLHALAPADPRACESLQCFEPPFPERPVHRGARRGGVRDHAAPQQRGLPIGVPGPAERTARVPRGRLSPALPMRNSRFSSCCTGNSAIGTSLCGASGPPRLTDSCGRARGRCAGTPCSMRWMRIAAPRTGPRRDG